VKKNKSTSYFIWGVAAMFPASPSVTPSSNRWPASLDHDSKYFEALPQLVWGVDPFEKVPGFAKVAEASTLPVLEAVFFNREESTALLNGEEYYTGEEVGDYRINEIGKNYVLLEKGESLIELNIRGVPSEPANAQGILIREHKGRTR
jgi:hypothetical protein